MKKLITVLLVSCALLRIDGDSVEDFEAALKGSTRLFRLHIDKYVEGCTPVIEFAIKGRVLVEMDLKSVKINKKLLEAPRL